ncbi:TPA: type II toxin-antitoxin system RelE/ParE family toxin [Escherichia coli]|uniref:type II toxin-antitoxin system RelE/ParE family toxin n=10 Tax=Enterobacteriaceae TaxID=543 RepID=UPI00396C403B
MEIFWTMLASQDRKRIRKYIAEQNLMAAIELDERIGYSASSLAGQPYKGRNGRVEGTRELVIHPHFVLVYEVDSQWGHCCKVSDEAAFCLIQRPYISKTLLTRRISPRGSP